MIQDRGPSLRPRCRRPVRHRGRLVDALLSGSYLALTHATVDFDPTLLAATETYRQRGIPRSHAAAPRWNVSWLAWNSSSRACRSCIAGGRTTPRRKTSPTPRSTTTAP